MLLTDKNYSIICKSFVKNDFTEDLTENADYLWQIGEDLENMPLLFEIARLFSCFLKCCCCVSHWYLEHVREVIKEYKVVYIATAKQEVTDVPALKTKIDHLFENDIVSPKIYREVRRIIDFERNLDQCVKGIYGVPSDLIDQSISELYRHDSLSLRDIKDIFRAILDVKLVARAKAYLVTQNPFNEQIVNIAIEEYYSRQTPVSGWNLPLRRYNSNVRPNLIQMELLDNCADIALAIETDWLSKIGPLPAPVRAHFEADPHFGPFFGRKLSTPQDVVDFKMAAAAYISSTATVS